MKQRQAVTKKKALTYRGADRAGRSRRPQPRWYSFTDGLPEQVLPGRDNRADLGEGGHHPPFPSLLLRHLAPGVSVPLEAFTPTKHWGFDQRRGLLTTTCCASWGHVPLSGCAYSRAAIVVSGVGHHRGLVSTLPIASVNTSGKMIHCLN